MSADPQKPASLRPPTTEPLTRALGRNEHVEGTVKKAGTDLSTVNAVLKNELSDNAQPTRIDAALNQSESIETNVQDAAAELAQVNRTLAEEVAERRDLERQLVEVDAELLESQDREREARHHALHDGLTGLANHDLFRDRLNSALAQAKRHAWRFAVMFIDLDDFKVVNDTHGHDVGDRVLQEVARRLEGSVRTGDTVSRRGGDEFLFLMLEAKHQANAAALAVKMLAALTEPYHLDGVTLVIKASIGIALYPDDGSSADDLLEHADFAMYAAKRERIGCALYSRVPHR